MADWHRRFMDLAEHVASWSKDPSTKVGCVIVGPEREVVSVGYNGFARGVDDFWPRYERPGKYLWVCHAEFNSIANASRTQARVFGCDLYVTSLPPCANCANLIVQTGIKHVFCVPVDPESPLGERWKDDNEIAAIILREGGVEVIYMEPIR